MIVTRRALTKREKTRRRFRYRWQKIMTPSDRMNHLMSCDGCVGCTASLEEISTYVEEADPVVW